MNHEPSLVVCPATRRPIHADADPAKGRGHPAIPPATIPRAPSAKRITPTPISTRRGSSPPVAPPLAGGGVRKLSGRVIGDRYGVTALIGEGGMGEVYEAEHLAIGRRVAVKVLHPKRAQDREASSRLRHEARVAGTLGHPNICAVYDLGRLDDGSPYLVMERLYGETLAQRLKRETTLPVGDLTEIVLQVLSALVAAHQKGIIHRDLKPDNIFLSRREGMSPVPKLLDFGISKAEDIEDTLVESKGNSANAGTPYYMSPEQARGERNFDLRVDLWALGVILYECLVGTRPFDAKNYNALLVHIQTKTPPSVDRIDPMVPSELARIVDKALAKDPDDRFQSAKEMQHAIRLVCEAEAPPVSKRFTAVREEAPPISSRRIPPLPPAPEAPPVSSRQRPPLPPAPEAPPVSSRQRPPIIVNEPTSDDGDGTFVFSRADMNLVRSAASREATSPPSTRTPPTPVAPPVAPPVHYSPVAQHHPPAPPVAPPMPPPPSVQVQPPPPAPPVATPMQYSPAAPMHYPPAPPVAPPMPPPPMPVMARAPIIPAAPPVPPAPMPGRPVMANRPAVMIEPTDEPDEVTHSLSGEDDKTPIYAPFVDPEEDHTVVESPSFLNDPSMNRRDTIPTPEPRRKD